MRAKYSVLIGRVPEDVNGLVCFSVCFSVRDLLEVRTFKSERNAQIFFEGVCQAEEYRIISKLEGTIQTIGYLPDGSIALLSVVQ